MRTTRRPSTQRALTVRLRVRATSVSENGVGVQNLILNPGCTIPRSPASRQAETLAGRYFNPITGGAARGAPDRPAPTGRAGAAARSVIPRASTTRTRGSRELRDDASTVRPELRHEEPPGTGARASRTIRAEGAIPRHRALHSRSGSGSGSRRWSWGKTELFRNRPLESPGPRGASLPVPGGVPDGL